MKIVLDTNVFISGIFWPGNFSSFIIESWKDNKFILVSSIPIIKELKRVLKDFKINMPQKMINKWEKIIIENSQIVEPKVDLEVVKDDPSDDKFIEAAVAGNADYIITKDKKHLLKLKKYKNIKIVSPENFWKNVLDK